MDNYHLFDEIGRGKGSVVYKGRRKKTIEYVAIKSVEKHLKNRVLNEVCAACAVCTALHSRLTAQHGRRTDCERCCAACCVVVLLLCCALCVERCR